MEEKQTFWKKLSAFVGGKGFYALMSLCLVVIAASAWALFGSLHEQEGTGRVYYAEEDSAAAAETPAPAQTAAPVPTEAPRHEEENVRAEAPLQTQPETVIPENTDTAEVLPEETEETVEANAAPEGWIWPVAGEIVLDFAPEHLVWNVTMADWRTHAGVDLAASMGTRVLAVSGGTVTAVGEDDLLGTYVAVDHGDGVESFYANLAATPAVAEGDTVKMGDVLGSVGDTALGEIGEQAHLHFAMSCDGESADPAEYLPAR